MSGVIDRISPPRLGSRFRWLLASSWVSNIGDGIGLAAGPLLVASQTNDPLLVALAAVLQRAPWLLFGLHAGAIADRLERFAKLVGRERVIAATDCGFGTTAARSTVVEDIAWA